MHVHSDIGRNYMITCYFPTGYFPHSVYRIGCGLEMNQGYAVMKETVVCSTHLICCKSFKVCSEPDRELKEERMCFIKAYE